MEWASGQDCSLLAVGHEVKVCTKTVAFHKISVLVAGKGSISCFNLSCSLCHLPV